MLRPYQQNAHDAVIDWIRKSIAPCLVEAATGAGKSHIIAALAETMREISGGKHVLCLAPSAELVEQNREKYLQTGNPASVMSASAGSKCLRHPVVFGTPLTVKGAAKHLGARFCMIIVDEAHGMTPTVKAVIESVRAVNPNVRVVGLTATPYAMIKGYIYRIDDKGKAVSQAVEPYFEKLVYRITAPELIAAGYLTRPEIGATGVASYDTSRLRLNSRMQYDSAEVDAAFVGHGRKTAAIVSDVIEQARFRNGVMFFAATVEHAQEIMASLPPSLSAIVTGETPKTERKRLLSEFKAQRIKYLVNVAVLTTGFDAPHVDVIAVLRKTESAGLYQQIIGRGLRLHEGKENCLVLDYAGNIDSFFPDGDVFSPEIRARFSNKEAEPLPCICPLCGKNNEFSARKNEEGFQVDDYGYYLDLLGERIKTDHGDMPAHFGRRCMHSEFSAAYPLGLRCEYRWTSKDCGECGHDNDIAARRCVNCKAELVDPNEKLRIDFRQLKKDPTRVQIDEVLSLSAAPTISRNGNECLRVEVVTPYRKFTVWLVRGRHEYGMFMANGNPKTVTYRKDPESGFYRIMAYNQEAQHEATK